MTVEEKTDRVKSYDGEIIPKSLLIKHFYVDELKALQKHQRELDGITAQLEELVEENSGEDGYFSSLSDMKATTVKACIKDVEKDAGRAEELAVLEEYLLQSEECLLQRNC